MSSFLYCTFNGVDLTALTGVTIDGIYKDSMPQRTLMRYPLARSDGQVQIGGFYADREINVSGEIIATDRATFESYRDGLLQYLVAQNANLDLNVGSTQMRFIATVAECIFSESKSGFGTFNIKFKCRDPWGIDPNLANLLAPTVITAQPSTQNLATVGGTYEAAPIITVNLNSATGFTAITNYMKFTNVVTGKYIQITRAFGTAELVEIDVFNKTVKVNRTDVDYAGNIYLPFAIGAGGQIKYEDNFTTRNITLKVQAYKRFL